MKQISNQRMIFKITSSFIKRNKYKLNISDLNSSLKNRFLVSIGDSNGLRIIRNIKQSPYTNEYINNVKKELKITRRNIEDIPKSLLKKRIKELNKKRLECTFEDAIVNVDFSNGTSYSAKDYKYLSENGFILNNKKYVLLFASTGQVKMNVVMFCREDIHDELVRRLYNDADLSVPFLPPKLMAYIMLAFSASEPLTNTSRILVVKDSFTHFKTSVDYIKFNHDTGLPEITNIPDYDMELNTNDGCGLVSEELMEQWSKDLQLDYIATSLCIRGSFMKGMITRFNFRKYCKEVLNTQYITDIYGETFNIDEVDIIVNESVFKLNKCYKNIHHYNECCLKNGFQLSATKTTPKKLEDSRAMNYQYVQTLDINDDEIDELLADDIREIQEVLGQNPIKSIIFSKGSQLNDKNVWRNDTTDDLYIKALMINPNCIEDDYIKNRIKKNIQKRIKQLKTGKISCVNSNYSICIGEPVTMLEGACGFEPKGLLNAGEFYIEYWRQKGIESVSGFRSPMTDKSNAVPMNICNREEVIKWYENLNNIIIFNAHDSSCEKFNGCDFDGDLIYTISNKIVNKGVKTYNCLKCESESGEKKPYPKKEDFIKSIEYSFSNKVGSITNFGSSLYCLLNNYPEDSLEYKEISYRLKSCQHFQQSCLDSCKLGKKPDNLPDYWINFRSKELEYSIDEFTGEILDTTDIIAYKDMMRKLVVDKKPYYFRYVYSHLDKEYRDYIKQTNSSCMRRFKVSVEGLKSKLNKTEEEIEFLEKYEKRKPLNDSDSIVNKIAWKVEKAFDNPTITRSKKDEFDYTVYQNKDDNSVGTANDKKKIKELYNEFMKSKDNQYRITGNDKDSVARETEDRDIQFKMAIEEIIPNRQELLNTLIEMSYKKSIISKGMCWLLVGDLMIENLLNNNKRIINYPIKDENGDIIYKFEKFKMIQKEIN